MIHFAARKNVRLTRLATLALLISTACISAANGQLASPPASPTDPSALSQSPSTGLAQSPGTSANASDDNASPSANAPDLLGSNGAFSDLSSPSANTTLSARAIISFLEQNPDAVVEIKGLAADRIRQQGGDVDENDISDQALYDQITTNASLRASISTFLRARGYEIQDDSPLPQTDARSSDQNGSIAQAQRMQAGNGNSSLLDSLAASGDTGALTPSLPSSSSHNGDAATGNREASARLTHPSSHSSTDAPQVLRRQAPYNLRSMRDLYTQIPDQATSLKRFGSDFFLARNQRAGALGSSSTSLDVPLGPDYILGPGDTLSIELWGGATLTLSRAIGRDGRILLPEAGSLQVAGLPLERAQTLIEGALKSQYRNAQVAVTVARLRSVRVYVVGDVQRPGGYDISSLATPLSALYAAGGPTSAGSLRTVRHMRGEQLVESIDLYEFFLHGMRSSTVHFESGDTLLTPPAGPQVALSGAIRRPAIYELKPGETTLATLVKDAGGLLPAASLDHVTVERIVAGSDRQTLTLNARPSTSAQAPHEAATQASLDAFELKDGDRIHVDPVLPYSDRAVYLEGHVARPGRVAYRDGMHLSDLLHSYRDLLPEPAAQGEIIRLAPPDLHAEAIAFNVPDVLIGNGDIPLQPFDTVRVRSRYEADAPRVTIQGEVLRPGAYPLSEGMTAAQLVRIAGGFKRDALRDRADLTSYDVTNGSSVDGRLQAVAIGAAVTGSDASADVPLKPGDILTIHQLTGWENVGESIKIDGQVRYPGVYGFKEGERLSSVLRRAGGLLPTAYPMGAIMVRDQVRELETKSREELIRQIQANSAAARLSPNLGSGDAGATVQLVQAQQNQILADLKSHPPTGRMVIHIAADIDSWANTTNDIELRRGDVLTVPKQPGFVLVTGQVYNATGLTFEPGKTAGWYLSHAGGTNTTANRKEIFIIRANGSVIGRHSSHSFGEGVLSTKLNPGDVVVVPQKIIGSGLFWKNLLTTAQLASSIAITAAVASI
jgi:protein involved in polysaccharide export with SLBB domain